MYPEPLKKKFINLSLRLILLGILFCDYGFGKIFHGIGIQMTNNGTGVYYKPYMPLNSDSQFIGDIGFHFDNNIPSASMFGVSSNNHSVFLNMSAGYRRELFNEMIAGVFKPVSMLQGGGSIKMESFSGHDIPENWIFICAAGVGFQFYNGRLLNEIMLQINQNSYNDLSMAFQLAIYWR